MCSLWSGNAPTDTQALSVGVFMLQVMAARFKNLPDASKVLDHRKLCVKQQTRTLR